MSCGCAERTSLKENNTSCVGCPPPACGVSWCHGGYGSACLITVLYRVLGLGLATLASSLSGPLPYEGSTFPAALCMCSLPFQECDLDRLANLCARPLLFLLLLRYRMLP